MNDEINKLLAKSEKVLKKKYRQFDKNPNSKSAADFIKNTVLKPNVISKYRFFPYIVYQQNQHRYHGTKGHLRAHLKSKKRPISLAAHHDALIYVKYADELNKKYEEYLVTNHIAGIPTAYRKALHKSNINAAKEVFDFVVESKNCWIIKGDFKGFFDNLKHKILKKNLCRVLSVDELSDDWEAVLKSVTKYRSVDSRALTNALSNAGIHYDNKLPYINNRKELGMLVSKGFLNIKGPNQLGIPQGTPISAVLANVYMTEFDFELNQIVSKMNGLYRRYSDDFVLVIPQKNLPAYEVDTFVSDVIKLSSKLTSLKIEPHKTKTYDYNINASNKMKSYDNEDGISNEVWFDYLGFIFNGKTVRMREKGVYRFHYKSKRAINSFLRIESDRRQIKTNSVPEAEQKSRKVWTSGQHAFQHITQVPKRHAFKGRIAAVKNKLPYNLTSSKMTARMYLVGARYGQRYSMVGYAKRAQLIFSDNNGMYQVEILSQVLRQLRINQKHVNKIRNHKV